MKLRYHCHKHEYEPMYTSGVREIKKDSGLTLYLTKKDQSKSWRVAREIKHLSPYFIIRSCPIDVPNSTLDELRQRVTSQMFPGNDYGRCMLMVKASIVTPISPLGCRRRASHGLVTR
jgi:hypothetical protein